MARCSYCDKESKIIFTCPYCENRFCPKHRKPEQHECPSTLKTTAEVPQVNEDQINEENTRPLEKKENLETPLDNQFKDKNFIEKNNNDPIVNGQKLEESIELVKAQTRAVLASIDGIQKDPKEFDEKDQLRYNKIYEYFLKSWTRTQELNRDIEKLSAEISSLKEKLNEKNIEYEQLIVDYKIQPKKK
ncbi:AN1-type zinc finger domain-containing protein [Thermoproteota archaeon]